MSEPSLNGPAFGEAVFKPTVFERISGTIFTDQTVDDLNLTPPEEKKARNLLRFIIGLNRSVGRGS